MDPFFLTAALVIAAFLVVAWFSDRSFGIWGVMLSGFLLGILSFTLQNEILLGAAVFTVLFCIVSSPILLYYWESRPPVGFFAALAAVLVSAWITYAKLHSLMETYDHMAWQFPLESLESRLAYEKKSPAGEHPKIDLPQALQERMEYRENRKEEYSWRIGSLERLHASTRTDFAMREGFGMQRMATLRVENMELPEKDPVPQPRPYDDSTTPEPGPIAQVEGDAEPLSQTQMLALHTSGENDFLASERNGFVRSRAEVAGFVPHRLEALPTQYSKNNDATTLPGDWKVARLELVSLLRHEKPVVYVADTLPNMKDLEKYTTRPLTPFEEAALERIRRQEDIVVEESPSRIRMVGSLRANKQCAACHEVPRGELLGAFSYILQRKQAAPVKPERKTEPST